MAENYLRLESDGNVEVYGNDQNKSVTFGLSAEVQQSLEGAVTALQRSEANMTDIAGIDTRITQLENSFAQGITSNPFEIRFDTLDGIAVTAGIWNKDLRRLEC